MERSPSGISRSEWLEYWGYKEGTMEAERAWLQKCDHDLKVQKIPNPNKPHGRLYELPSYQSPVTGKWIDGRAARRRDLQENNCVEYEPSMKEEQEKRFAAEDARIDKEIEESFDKEVATMPTIKREKLVSELENGVDITVSRE